MQLFNNELLILLLILFFLFIDNNYDLKFPFENIKSRKSSKISKFQNCFQYPYRFQFQSKIIRVIEIKKNIIDPMNIVTLYNNCYEILTTYMVD